MDIRIRKEEEKDFNEIYEAVKEAFLEADHRDGDEHNLVNRLRGSKSYIKNLSLVAAVDGMIVGYIMMTKLRINGEEGNCESLALAPLAVIPEFQNKGVGSKLIKAALKNAEKLGYKSVIVLGSEKYYPKFGFKKASDFNITPPFEVPEENFMAIEIEKGALKNVSGTVEYAKEFFEQ